MESTQLPLAAHELLGLGEGTSGQMKPKRRRTLRVVGEEKGIRGHAPPALLPVMAAECAQGTEGVRICQWALGIGGEERSGERRGRGEGPRADPKDPRRRRIKKPFLPPQKPAPFTSPSPWLQLGFLSGRLGRPPLTRPGRDPLGQRSPTFLAPGTGFVEDNFSVDAGGRGGEGMVQAVMERWGAMESSRRSFARLPTAVRPSS